MGASTRTFHDACVLLQGGFLRDVCDLVFLFKLLPKTWTMEWNLHKRCKNPFFSFFFLFFGLASSVTPVSKYIFACSTWVSTTVSLNLLSLFAVFGCFLIGYPKPESKMERA